MNRREVLIGGGALVAGVMGGRAAFAQRKPVRALCWSEGTAPKNVYPHEISGAVADALREGRGFEIHTAGLSDPEQGLSGAALAQTDVLFWWGHQKHADVDDARVDAIVKRIKEGMGLVALHSSHPSKPLTRAVGFSGSIGGVGVNESPEHIHVKAPSHPIARGIHDFDIPREEFYNEPFGIKEPDVLVFQSTWDTGQTFRSGCVWNVEKGRVFYFRPGHETFPTYFQKEVKQILVNAGRWCGHGGGRTA